MPSVGEGPVVPEGQSDTLRATREGWEGKIPFAYHNLTDRTISLVNCRGSFGLHLEKREDGDWVRAWEVDQLHPVSTLRKAAFRAAGDHVSLPRCSRLASFAGPWKWASCSGALEARTSHWMCARPPLRGAGPPGKSEVLRACTRRCGRRMPSSVHITRTAG